MTSRKSLYRQNVAEKAQGKNTGKAPVVLFVAIVKYDYVAQEEDDLDMRVGDKIHCIDRPDDDPDWPEGMNTRTNTIGRFPLNYVDIISGSGHKDSSNAPKVKIRASVIDKAPESIVVNLSGNSAKTILNYVAKVEYAYQHDQNDEHDLVVGDLVLVTHKSIEDEDWVYGQIGGQGETRLFPLEHVKRVSTSPKMLSMMKPTQAAPSLASKLQQQQPGGVKKSVRMSISMKGGNKNISSGLKDSSKLKTFNDSYYRCTENFEPENPDELEIKVGQIVKAEKETEDPGWYEGLNLSTNERGVFCDEYCVKTDPPKKSNLTDLNAGLLSDNEDEAPGQDDIYGFVNDFTENIPAPTKPVAANKRASLMQGSTIANNATASSSSANFLCKIPPPNTPVKGYFIVIEEYDAEQPDEFNLKKGQIYEALQDDGEGWWIGRLKGSEGKCFAFCDDFMEKYTEPKPKPQQPVSTPRISLRSSKQSNVNPTPPPPSSSHIAQKTQDHLPVDDKALQDLTTRLAESEQKQIELSATIGNMEKMLQEAMSVMKESKAENDSLKTANEKLNNKLKSFEQRFDKFESQTNSEFSSIRSINSQLSGLKSDITALKSDINDVRAKSGSIDISKLNLDSSEQFEHIKKRVEKLKNTIIAQNTSIGEISKKQNEMDFSNFSRRLTSLEARLRRHE